MKAPSQNHTSSIFQMESINRVDFTTSQGFLFLLLKETPQNMTCPDSLSSIRCWCFARTACKVCLLRLIFNKDIKEVPLSVHAFYTLHLTETLLRLGHGPWIRMGILEHHLLICEPSTRGPAFSGDLFYVVSE